jgi:hypothetical protein
MFLVTSRCNWISIFVFACVYGGGAPAQAQTTLSYKFAEGEKLHYAMDTKTSVQMQPMGSNIEMRVGQTIDLTWSVLSVDNDQNAKLQSKVDRLRFSMEGGPIPKTQYDSKEGKKLEGVMGDTLGPLFEALVGAEFTFNVDARGNLSDVQIPAKLNEALKNMTAGGAGSGFSGDMIKQMAQQGALLLPSGTVEKGKTWEQTSQMTLPFGKAAVRIDLTYEGPATLDGKQVEKIAVSPKMSFEAGPNAAVAIKIKGQESKGTTYFDNKAGLILQSSLTQTTEMEITVAGAVMPQKMTQTISFKLQGKDK